MREVWDHDCCLCVYVESVVQVLVEMVPFLDEFGYSV